MNNDVELNKEILTVFKEAEIGEKWVIDANASWSVENAIIVLEIIKELKIAGKLCILNNRFRISLILSNGSPSKKHIIRKVLE